jgi:NADH-quinone oxidoreductase subunit L
MDIIWLVLAFPLLGSLLCATHYKTLGKTSTGTLASLAILGAFLVSAQQWLEVQQTGAFVSKLNSWLELPGVSGLHFSALVDDLSTTMLCTVTGVAFLIHCYSMGYMSDEEDYGRFFASLNLFVATMVLLVLAANLGLLLVGWGGVGYASYSLIGFYRQKPSAVSAARKAFLINVVGDVGIMLALFLVVSKVGSADFQTFLRPEKLALLGPEILTVGALLLLGSYAKSAQLPLHPWLPDAMEGPTPVSALIHAATMVTAGVYLTARCAPLYQYGAAGTDLMPIIACLGAATALTAALCAIVQTDLKRILAYSTMSQLGYMFMACGVGAYGAAIFHLVTHAFFKALLFLTAGVVIHAMHGEQDITRMGGLKKHLPGARWAFLIGAAALSGIPPLAGFVSKEEILLAAYFAPIKEGVALWGVGMLTALLTAYYTGRAYWLTFEAKPAEEHQHLHYPGSSMTWPLAVLSLATLLAGLGGALVAEVQIAVGAAPLGEHHGQWQQWAAIGVAASGVLLARAYHSGGRASLVPKSWEPVFRGCEAIDQVLLACARSLRRGADWLALQIDPITAQRAPDLIRRSMTETSKGMCQLQGGSLRLYVMAVLSATALFAIAAYIMVIFGPGGAA